MGCHLSPFVNRYPRTGDNQFPSRHPLLGRVKILRLTIHSHSVPTPGPVLHSPYATPGSNSTTVTCRHFDEFRTLGDPRHKTDLILRQTSPRKVFRNLTTQTKMVQRGTSGPVSDSDELRTTNGFRHNQRLTTRFFNGLLVTEVCYNHIIIRCHDPSLQVMSRVTRF